MMSQKVLVIMVQNLMKGKILKYIAKEVSKRVAMMKEVSKKDALL